MVVIELFTCLGLNDPLWRAHMNLWRSFIITWLLHKCALSLRKSDNACELIDGLREGAASTDSVEIAGAATGEANLR